MTKRMITLMVAIGFLMAGGKAEAGITENMTYSSNVIWRCAVRFVRVDNGFEIIEKDRDSGYLMFKYQKGAATSVGALEMFEVVEGGKKYVRVQLNVQRQPKYVESLLFKKLERKLKSEYGSAPDAASVQPVPKQPGIKDADEVDQDIDEDTDETLVIDED